jgi:hypothetical protein
MSQPSGKFISIDDAGKSDSEPNPVGNSDDQSKSGKTGIGEPEPEHAIDAEYIEPSAIRIDDDIDGPRRTRSGRIDGRSKQARAAREAKPGNLSGLSVKDLLIGICSSLQVMTGIPEFEIDDDEAKIVGDACVELGKVYGSTISPKVLAWSNFAAALGRVGGTRVVAYQARIRNERASKPGPVRVDKTKPASAPAASKFPTPGEMWQEPLEGW